MLILFMAILCQQVFDFYDKLSIKDYGRSIDQIYLCHDNKINSDFLAKLVDELKKKDYKFVRLDKALTDKVYSSKDNYLKKWGISWFYRWMPTQKERVKWMRQEPSTSKIEKLYNTLSKQQ